MTRSARPFALPEWWRDTRELGKDIELKITGAESELDKSMVEKSPTR